MVTVELTDEELQLLIEALQYYIMDFVYDVEDNEYMWHIYSRAQNLLEKLRRLREESAKITERERETNEGE